MNRSMWFADSDREGEEEIRDTDPHEPALLCEPCAAGDHDDCERIIVVGDYTLPWAPRCACEPCKTKPHRCGICGCDELTPSHNDLSEYCYNCGTWIDEDGTHR